MTESLLFSDRGDDDSDVYLKLFDLKNVFDDEFNNENQPDWNVTIQFSSFWDYNYTTPSELDSLPGFEPVSIPWLDLNSSFDLNTTTWDLQIKFLSFKTKL